MTSKIKTIHLLAIEPSSNKAEEIISFLRNKGYAVRATQVLSSDELVSALEKGVSDLLLANLDYDKLSPKQAVEKISEYGRDIPCLVLMKDTDEKQLLEIMEYGAKDGVPIDNVPLICKKAERELEALGSRRKKVQTELLLKAAEKRCTTLLDSSQDAVAYVHDGMHVYANKAYLELYNYTDIDELMCIPALDTIASESQDEFRQYLKKMSAASDQQSFSFVGVKSDSESFEALMTLSTANYDEEVCTQILIRAAADNAELEEKLKELSSQDTLTDLFNKQHFTEQLQKTIEEAREQGKSSNALYIEYDQSKSILQEFGLAGVDKITQDCATWLASQVKDSNVLSRVSDHSYAMISNDSPKDVKEFAEQLCEKISSQLFDIEGSTVKLTFSIGICPVGEDSEDATQVLSDALSTAGRVEQGNGVKLFNKAIQSATSEVDAKMLEELQEALESQRMKLLFQPIGKIHGEEKQMYQVFLRVSNAQGEEMDSGKVIQLAKAAGFGEKLDRWVINQSLRSIKEQNIGSDVQLFVNLNAVSLIDAALPQFINKLFTAGGINKNNIVFQIEESDAANHLKRVIALSAELRKEGYSLCLSGYGGDPEQKGLLDQIDVEFVKISGEISKNVHTNSDDAEQVENLIMEIHNRDKTSIVPRVEEAAMLAALWPMNVKYVIGYYLQKPGEKMDYDFSASGF
ncbi:MAG: EAL domain-containing protein [Gammaproteobacteria bacterium]|nr:EAL domain-containing protein [Gammaproteobacteria bacterium]MDH5629534.1 EAL domain-containing protein [Gammaproteobacteria bacterium]